MSNRLYTDKEIRAEYYQAKDKKLQIKILADLNCCSAEEIRKIIFQEDTPMDTKLEYTCPVCQNENHPADAKYCIICGNKIEEESTNE